MKKQSLKKQPLTCLSKILTLAITAMATLTLSSCATLSKQECTLGDWHSIGYRDGTNGNLPSYIGEHQKACAKASVLPDYKTWELGRQEGLKKYCTESNAYGLGKMGSTLNNVCPVGISDKLEKLNAKGRKIHTLKTKVESSQKKLDTYKEELSKLKDGEMLEFKTEKEARKYMIGLPAKMKKLEADIITNQWQLDNESYR